MLIIALKLIVGLVLLVLAANWLVKGASRLAARFGIPSLVIGLTVVALGTSAPELAVAVQSAYSGSADIALGNVVGSNICNVLLILGVSALIVPLTVHAQLIRVDVPLMIAVSVLVYLLSLDGKLGRVDALLLVSGLVGYVGFLLIQARRETPEATAEFDAEYGNAASKQTPLASDVALIVVGLMGLVLGANLLVGAAVTVATLLGVSQLVIGLTVVAVGTSLPEIATSIIAATKGERDIAVGNVVGSNILNILAVLGLASLVSPSGIAVADTAMAFDLPIMIAVSVACLPVFARGSSIQRWEGGLFVFLYLAYTLYLLLTAQQHLMLGGYRQTMLWGVLPLTAVALVVITALALRERGWLGAKRP